MNLGLVNSMSLYTKLTILVYSIVSVSPPTSYGTYNNSSIKHLSLALMITLYSVIIVHAGV